MTDRRRTIVYIDGFNFYYGAIRGTPYKWLDLEALCKRLLPNDHLTKIRYFTARIKARPDDPQQHNRQGTYLRAISTLPLIEIHYGRFVTRRVSLPRVERGIGESRTVAVLKTEEKGSDVNLAAYLLLDAFKNLCDTAVVISNDSDLAQAIQITQSELGIKVGIINPHPRKKQSRQLLDLKCLFYRQIPQHVLEEAQLPRVVADHQARIRKPDTW